MRTEPYADLCRVLTDLPTTLAESMALLPRNLAATATPSVAAGPGARQPENDRHWLSGYTEIAGTGIASWR